MTKLTPSATFHCRICGGSGAHTVLDLGEMPLANSLLDRPDQSEARYPLRLVFCESCTLVQIVETVPPAELFKDYVYFSSFSDTMVAHASELVARTAAAEALGTNSLVVELASNDGYLLQFYRDKGIPVLGIDPAANVVAVAEQRGIPTRCAFFDVGVAQGLVAEGIRADVMHANNVLAHVADLHGFVEGIRLLLKPEGVAILEMPYLRDLVDRCEFDTIYHEHLCYFSLSALVKLFERHGLVMQDVERMEIHGGSLRVSVMHAASARVRRSTVDALLASERRTGLGTLEYYRSFAEQVQGVKAALRALLADLKRGGTRIAAYGASAKGATLLNFFGIGSETLEFVADRSTVKQGKYTPGTHIPIVGPEALLERKPDYTLLLTWNFADEILRQQKEYRTAGGRFVIPVPDVRVV